MLKRVWQFLRREKALVGYYMTCGYCEKRVIRKAMNQKWCSRNCGAKAWTKRHPGYKYTPPPAYVTLQQEYAAQRTRASMSAHELALELDIPEWKAALYLITGFPSSEPAIGMKH